MVRPHIMDRLQLPNFTDAQQSLIPQQYVANNRGDMFVPSGYVNAESIRARLATPNGMGGRNVHAIPVTYVRVTADVRTRMMIGMKTPEYKAVGIED